MRKLYSFLLLILCFLSVKAQTITPNPEEEYCPNTPIAFTFTVPGVARYLSYYQSQHMAVISNLSTSTANNVTTFTFNSQFFDAPNTHSFNFNYELYNATTEKWVSVTSPQFQYKKIKSLFNSLNVPAVNLFQFDAPRCTVTTKQISFPNMKYKNPDTGVEFGEITQYQYLVPVNWKVNGSVSTGTSDWKTYPNNVTIESDLSSGIGGTVYVRGLNSCATSNAPSNTKSIPISRPIPPLTISGTQNYICSGTADFQINGMPSGATIVWSLSNTTNASISGCSNCSTVTVSRNTSANTIVTLYATVTDCTGPYTPVPYQIALGSPQPQNLQFLLIDPVMGKLQARVDPVLGATGYQWYKDGQLFTYPGGGTGSNIVQFNISRSCDVWYNIAVEAVNACGTSAQIQDWAYVPCDNYYMVSPNPATTEVNVTSDPTKTLNGTAIVIEEVRIYDLQGNLKKYQKYSKVKGAKINVTGLNKGTYFIEIINGTYKERKQLLIQR